MKLKIVNPNAAGIDIAYGEMQVCVPEDRDGENNRCFGIFTCDYEDIASWLKACGITTVAMESTGSYWVGLYFFLEEKGFDVLLANAKDVSDKKTGLGIYFRRQKSKGGHLQAIVATANKIARIFYTIVVSKNHYDESKVGLDEKHRSLYG